MPITKREVLEQLKRAELVTAVDRFELSVADRRVRDLLIDALESSPLATAEKIIGVLTPDRLKEISRALGVDERLKKESAAPDRGTPGERPGAGGFAPAGGDFAPPRRDAFASGPGRPRPTGDRFAPDRGGPDRGGPDRGGPDRGGPDRGRFAPRPDRAPHFDRRPRPSGPPRGKPINIQDGYLFESLKENRLLQFALVTGQQIKGRIRRFDQFTVLVDTGERQVLIYKSALSDIAAG